MIYFIIGLVFITLWLVVFSLLARQGVDELTVIAKELEKMREGR